MILADYYMYVSQVKPFMHIFGIAYVVCIVLAMCVSDSIVMRAGSCAVSMLSGRVCVLGRCCATLNADQLWALVMSHTVMSHKRGMDQNERLRGQTDKGITKTCTLHH